MLYVIVSNLIKDPSFFAKIFMSGLQLGFVYALIALGYTMVYGIVKLINFAHGDVFMVGAFVSYYAVATFRAAPVAGRRLPRLPAGAFPRCIGSITVILLSMLVCMLLAVTIERVAYKPLRDAPRIAALITAIGVSFFLEYFGALNFVFSPRFIPYQRPFEVVAWYISGRHPPDQPGQAPPANAVTFSNILLLIIAASIVRAAAAAVPGAPHQDRHGHARHLLRQAHRAPDGHQRGPGHLVHLRHRRRLRRAGRGAVRHRLQLDLDPAGHPARA